MDHFDYPAAATVWQRVNPQEEPYPNVERGRFEMPQQQQQQGNRPMPPAPVPMPMPPQNGSDGQQMYRALLREEMRHLQQVISVLEKALA
mgnify:CR=1 FL=1